VLSGRVPPINYTQEREDHLKAAAARRGGGASYSGAGLGSNSSKAARSRFRVWDRQLHVYRNGGKV